MATTDLRLDDPGTHPRPGPVGRAARAIFGLLCAWLLVELMNVSANVLDTDGHIDSLILGVLAPGLFLISYVVNIGFSRSWKKWPAFASLFIFLVVGAFGLLSEGVIETDLLARAIWVWEFYLFSHLGLSFILAAILGTPGCEMRSLHDLYSRLTDTPVKEHRCPIGPLSPIDRWETGRRHQ